jgi:anaerobic magnesium-protoporphyrin IX monomethyl ester cyclase
MPVRVLMIQPNYHAGGAEIAGNWPPGWVAYIGGALKGAGFTNLRFIDAMTNHIDDAYLEQIIRHNAPDVVLATAITPMIYQAQKTLEVARRAAPGCVTVLGGIHPTFMYSQVLGEAPWIDYIVRGEGEEIIVELLRAIEDGSHLAARRTIQGIAFLEDGKVVATPARPVIEDLDGLTPDWSLLEWDKYVYVPLNTRVAVPNFARGCPFTCRFCSQWKFWRKYRVRDPKKFADEIETLVRDFKVGFFILADEEPTIHRKKFVALCQELIARKLDVHWGINTRVTDILRDRELLPMFRKAGLVHVSLGTEAAAQLKLDRFRKETTIEQNKLAIRLLKEAGMVAEAQFIMGLENETRETIEETYKLAQDWKPDMANWNMYTPWPFAELFEELGDRVEVRDYAKYNFVTPIIQPDAISREQVLKGVLKNYARFYLCKAFLSYPWIRDRFKRRYMLGCLRAFAKTTATKKFYDLERLKYDGLSAQVDLGFDQSKVLRPEQIAALREQRPDLDADVNYRGTPLRIPVKVMACGGAGQHGPTDPEASAAIADAP